MEKNNQPNKFKMTRDEALKIIELYRNWHVGQKSVSLATTGKRTPEDDVYDERRKLISVATTVLSGEEIRQHFKSNGKD